jgi:hypothetical protein
LIMNKIIIRVVLLLFTAGLIFLILFNDRSPFGKSNSSFASVPRTDITKIEFSSSGEKMYLEKKGDKWLINGQHETRRSGLIFIEMVLKEMKIKSPVSSDIFDEEIIKNGIEPIRIRVYEKRKLLKTFLVYKTTSNIYGNIMKIKERSKPFIVYVPGFDGDIGSIFTLNELYWQPYSIFNLLPSEISSVSFENISDPASSFSIVHKDQNFIFSDLTVELTGWDSARVIRYLSYFTWIPFEAWAFEIGDEEKRKIEVQQPLYRITVITTKNIKTVLTLWERMINANNNDGIKDSDRLLGKTQMRDEFFIIRYFDIDPLIKKQSYFFPE